MWGACGLWLWCVCGVSESCIFLCVCYVLVEHMGCGFLVDLADNFSHSSYVMALVKLLSFSPNFHI